MTFSSETQPNQNTETDLFFEGEGFWALIVRAIANGSTSLVQGQNQDSILLEMEEINRTNN